MALTIPELGLLKFVGKAVHCHGTVSFSHCSHSHRCRIALLAFAHLTFALLSHSHYWPFRTVGFALLSFALLTYTSLTYTVEAGKNVTFFMNNFSASTNGVYSSLFRGKASGGTQKRGKPEMRSSCRNSLDLLWSWPQPGRGSASVPHLRYLIPVSQSPF